MKCPNCVLGDLQFHICGELRFQTDAQGRPYGTADIHSTSDQFWLACDTCQAAFGVQGWRDDGAGEAILTEMDLGGEDQGFEAEPKSPPPGAQRVD